MNVNISVLINSKTHIQNICSYEHSLLHETYKHTMHSHARSSLGPHQNHTWENCYHLPRQWTSASYLSRSYNCSTSVTRLSGNVQTDVWGCWLWVSWHCPSWSWPAWGWLVLWLWAWQGRRSHWPAEWTSTPTAIDMGREFWLMSQLWTFYE